MRVEPTTPRHLDEDRRYFPDWVDGLPECPSELEADRNSYLAGGYAEEFGYRCNASCSRGVPVLEDELPELCPECCGQTHATHPGYPIRPCPLAAELEVLLTLARRVEVPTRDTWTPHVASHRTIVVSEHSQHRHSLSAILSRRLVSAAIHLKSMVGRY